MRTSNFLWLAAFLVWAAPSRGACVTSRQADPACNSASEVCVSAETCVSAQRFRDASGSARVTLYKAPREKGPPKGYVIFVFGFGPPKPAAECLQRAPSTSVQQVGGAPIPVQLGYDFIEVDWCNPYDFLEQNGMVLRELIEETRPTLTATQTFFVGGTSMGGLISRYILTQLESEGFDHGVDVWMTSDAPLKGAYVPLSVLLLGEVAASSGFVDAGPLQPVIAAANANSARQMLLAYHVSQPPGRPHAEHVTFFDNLENLGSFPKSIDRTVAIASGAGTGRAAHPVHGLAWPVPIDRRLTTVNVEIFGVVLPIHIDFRGTFALRLLPLTTPKQEVVRTEITGDILINGRRTRLDLETLSVDGIVAAVVDVFQVPGILIPLANWILGPIIESVFNNDDFVPASLRNALLMAEADFGYEALAGGLADEYGNVAEFLDGASGNFPNVFVPTYSALAANHAPDTDLTRLSEIDTPFSEVVFQSRDLAHTASDSDVVCRELRRMAGVPYITELNPAVRLAGSGDFNLSVIGGNFTAQTVVSWEGQARTTTFVSSALVRARIPIEDIAQPSLVSRMVSVNSFDGGGNIPAEDFYADLASCEKIGVTVQSRPILIDPPLPTANDTITATFGGVWNNGCIPTNPQVTSTQLNQVEVTATNPGQFCTQIVRPYSLSASFGPLPEGQYGLAFNDQRPFGGTRELGERSFSVTAARPTIGLLSPAIVAAGGPGVTLTVEGTDFSSGVSLVHLNGIALPTTFVDSSRLEARIPAVEVAVPGTAAITVRSGSDRLVSEPATFTISEAPPSIGTINPSSAVEGSESLSLFIEGMHFAPEAIVQWTDRDGVANSLTTQRISPTLLEVTAPMNLLSIPGSYQLVVSSGGLISVPGFFVVERIAGTEPSVMAPVSAQNQVLTQGSVSQPLVVQVDALSGSPAANVIVVFVGPEFVELHPIDGSTSGNPVQVRTDSEGRAGVRVEWPASATVSGPGQNTRPGQSAPAITIVAAVTDQLTTTFELNASGRSPEFSAAGFVNAATFVSGIVPGGLATLFGAGLSEGVQGTVLAEGATSFGGTTVRIGGFAAPLLSITGPSSEQINLQVPFEVSAGQTTVEVENNGTVVSVSGIPVFSEQPGIFEIPLPTGGTVGAVIHASTGQLVTPQNPAQRQEPLSIFFTGGGALRPAVNTGALGPIPPAVMTESLTVSFDDREALLLFSGYAPGFVGLYQANFTIPAGGGCGPLALRIQVGELQSSPSTTSVVCP